MKQKLIIEEFDKLSDEEQEEYMDLVEKGEIK
jgi:hypothetical protein